MIKVLDKTFGILEEIIKATPHPMGPMALAEALELNRATCYNIKTGINRWKQMK